jgi:hypothetical protein
MFRAAQVIAIQDADAVTKQQWRQATTQTFNHWLQRMALSAAPAFSNTKAYLCLDDKPVTNRWLGLSAHPVPFHPQGIFRERLAHSCFFGKMQLPIPGREAFPT